jgi:hypothetical protein
MALTVRSSPAPGLPPELRRLADHTRPVALARQQRLPVLDPLAPLLPGGALRRGTTVAVTGGDGATSLALALAAGPSAAGSWVAVVGLADLGLPAAAELGVALDRLAVVRRPPPASWGTVVAALVGAFDVVLLAPAHRVRAADARRLAARARERGSVLVVLAPVGERGGGSALEPDVALTVTATRWEGLGQGHGHLRARRVEVVAGGRRDADRPTRLPLWLPSPDPAVPVAPASPGGEADTATAGDLAPVVPLRPAAPTPNRLGNLVLQHEVSQPERECGVGEP